MPSIPDEMMGNLLNQNMNLNHQVAHLQNERRRLAAIEWQYTNEKKKTMMLENQVNDLSRTRMILETDIRVNKQKLANCQEEQKKAEKSMKFLISSKTQQIKKLYGEIEKVRHEHSEALKKKETDLESLKKDSEVKMKNLVVQKNIEMEKKRIEFLTDLKVKNCEVEKLKEENGKIFLEKNEEVTKMKKKFDELLKAKSEEIQSLKNESEKMMENSEFLGERVGEIVKELGFLMKKMENEHEIFKEKYGKVQLLNGKLKKELETARKEVTMKRESVQAKNLKNSNDPTIVKVSRKRRNHDFVDNVGNKKKMVDITEKKLHNQEATLLTEGNPQFFGQSNQSMQQQTNVLQLPAFCMYRPTPMPTWDTVSMSQPVVHRQENVANGLGVHLPSRMPSTTVLQQKSQCSSIQQAIKTETTKENTNKRMISKQKNKIDLVVIDNSDDDKIKKEPNDPDLNL